MNEASFFSLIVHYMGLRMGISICIFLGEVIGFVLGKISN
jgi:hypothetical protein